jgi:ATP-dependent DNA ligase
MKLVEIDEADEALEYASEKQFWSEPKFNGWHLQIVNGRIFSRRGKDLTGKFREIASQVAKYRGSHLLGELVYWGPDGVMDEPAVTHVAGTKNPVEASAKLEAMPGAFQLVLFDVLAECGRDVTKESTEERRDRLDRMVRPTWEVALSPAHPFKVWKELYDEVTGLGGDGVVFKNSESPYYWRPLGEHEARPMGVWFKLKPSSTDDFIVTGTHYGPKGRLILELSQYNDGEFVFVSEMSNIARDLESVFEKRAKKGPFVIEVEFQSRFPDPPGALQHPRFLRVREDKGPEQAVLPARYAS